MATATEKQYTPEELAEIERIVEFVTGEKALPDTPEDAAPPVTDDTAGEVEPVEDLDFGQPEDLDDLDDMDIAVDAVDSFDHEPEDLDLPAGDLDNLMAADEEPVAEEMSDIEEVSDIPEGFEDVSDFFSEADDIVSDSPDLSDVKEEGLDEISDIEDITGLVEEIEEPSAEFDEIPEESFEDIEPLDDISTDLEEIPEETIVPEVDEEPAAMSALDELDALTSDEPESLDAGDIAPDDTFVGGEDISDEIEVPAEFEEPGAVDEVSDFDDITDIGDIDAGEDIESLDDMDGLDDIGGLDDLSGDELASLDDIGEVEDIGVVDEITPEGDEAVSLGAEDDSDIPDLSDISFDDGEDIPEAVDTDIPDIDIGDIGADDAGMDDDLGGITSEMDDLADESFDSIDDMDDLGDLGPGVSEEPAGDMSFDDAGPGDMVVDEIDDLGPMVTDDSDIADIDDEEALDIELLDDDAGPVAVKKPAAAQESSGDEESIELSDSQLKKLKKAIMLFNPSLRQVIKDVVVQDQLPVKETKQLVEMIISSKPESNIHRFMEKKLNRTINLADEKSAPGRRVITARPEYTAEGRERQKKLLKRTKIAGIAALITAILTLAGYQFIYKPIMAKRIINKGVSLIVKSGSYLEKSKHFKDAEKLFKDVDDDYITDYVYGYTKFSQAYFQKGEYDRSLDKLNRIYTIQYKQGKDIDLDVLNSLGLFYARVPKEHYSSIQSSVDTWYYPKRDVKRQGRSQLDVAIEFYRRVLVRDSKNISALYGIGNAYYYQGQYVKAKKYYEDILRLDPDSKVGFSGLLNLYIERDEFTQVVTVHTRLRDREMIHELPPALLAKWASYYLDKTKTDKMNVRVDYGVLSKRFKDVDDNIYPAVQSVLKALNKQDPHYPPLHLQYARLNMVQKNYRVMKRYLDNAIKLAPTYYGALHLMGEYYYYTKEPVQAYEYLNRALRSYGNQPEFVHHDFYKETESLGETHALLGNIFYYFFDKVKARYGDLEDDKIDDEMDKMANFNIARDKYEKALSEGFESSEIHYNLGRIFYMNKLYSKALDQWLHLYEDFTGHPELMFALGNAFYHLGKFEASKGEYMKLVTYFEFDADSIKSAKPGEEKHIKLFQSLASTYNNLGAVYQLQNNEEKSHISYWKAIEYAKRVGRENEFARVNLARSFKKTGGSSEPVLDENIPYSIDVYREEMRK